MATSTIPYVKGVNEMGLIYPPTNLNDLCKPSDNGFYYVGAGVTNSPSDYSGLIVLARDTGWTVQIAVSTDGTFYTRMKAGSPLAWNSWKHVT